MNIIPPDKDTSYSDTGPPSDPFLSFLFLCLKPLAASIEKLEKIKKNEFLSFCSYSLNFIQKKKFDFQTYNHLPSSTIQSISNELYELYKLYKSDSESFLTNFPLFADSFKKKFFPHADRPVIAPNASSPTLDFTKIQKLSQTSKKKTISSKPPPKLFVNDEEIITKLNANSENLKDDSFTFRAYSNTDEPITREKVLDFLDDFNDEIIKSNDSFQNCFMPLFAEVGEDTILDSNSTPYFKIKAFPDKSLPQDIRDFVLSFLGQTNHHPTIRISTRDSEGFKNATVFNVCIPFTYTSLLPEFIPNFFEPYGKIIVKPKYIYPTREEQRLRLPGTTTTATLIVSLTNEKIPPKIIHFPLIPENPQSKIDISISVNSNLSFCNYCRSTKHTIHFCPRLSPCTKCKSHNHTKLYCNKLTDSNKRTLLTHLSTKYLQKILDGSITEMPFFLLQWRQSQLIQTNTPKHNLDPESTSSPTSKQKPSETSKPSSNDGPSLSSAATVLDDQTNTEHGEDEDDYDPTYITSFSQPNTHASPQTPLNDNSRVSTSPHISTQFIDPDDSDEMGF